MLHIAETNYYYFYDVFLKHGDVYMIGPYYPRTHYPSSIPILSYLDYTISGQFIDDRDKHTSIWKFPVKSANKPRITVPVNILYCHHNYTFELEQERNTMKHNISISTTMKNEYTLLKPWLDFHIFSGVNHFYLYDNNSDDQKRLFDILNPYINKGYVTVIPWKFPYRSIQEFPLPLDSVYFCSIVAINHCIHKYGQETDWLITMDVDEYLVPKIVDRIEDFVNIYEHADIAGIYIPDYVFGSNTSTEPLLVKRFLTRSDKISPWLCSGKVLLHPDRVNFCEVHIITNGGKMVIANPDSISINHYHYSKTSPRLKQNPANNLVKDTRCLELWNMYFSEKSDNSNNRIISIKDFGTWARLGNQMFQYAYLRVLAEVHGFKIQLPRLKSPFGYAQAQLFDAFDIDIEKLDRDVQFDTVKETTMLFDEKLSSKNIQSNKNIMFEGYFQSERYFSKYRELIRETFTFKKMIQQKGDAYVKTLNKYSSLVALHIRRGDNLDSGSPTVMISDTFIKKALEKIHSLVGNYHILVFSDDKKWCQNNLHFLNHTLVNGFTDLEELYIMSQCDHFIIAPSSFSWWGAWLSNNKDKIVLTQTRWFKHNITAYGRLLSEQERDIIPSDWTQISI